MRAVNESRETTLAERVAEATRFVDRLVGWMGKRPPAPSGLLISPCRSIHTCFMRFPIDALFLDESGTVVTALENLPPWRVTGVAARARSVLELPAGTIGATKTREGDRVALVPYP